MSIAKDKVQKGSGDLKHSEHFNIYGNLFYLSFYALNDWIYKIYWIDWNDWIKWVSLIY